MVAAGIPKTEKEWREKLTPMQYNVLREKGTEQAFSGKYFDHHEKGTYVCAGCGSPLFSSDAKFDSGTGWPSFYAPISEKNVAEKTDESHEMARREVLCARCQGHLGHVFDDLPAGLRQVRGPRPARKRFCINSAALEFKQKEQ